MRTRRPPGCLAALVRLLLLRLAAPAAVTTAPALLLLGSSGRGGIVPWRWRRLLLRPWRGRGGRCRCSTRGAGGKGLMLHALLHPFHPAFL